MCRDLSFGADFVLRRDIPERNLRHRRMQQNTAAKMLTKDILFGMNALTLLGFTAMGFGLTLRRMASASLPVCLVLMSAGTALVFAGLYTSGSH